MGSEAEPTNAAQRYSTAYLAHYSKRDLPLALQLYRELLAADPGTPESEFARMQVLNIVHAVVPGDELLDASIELALLHFGAELPEHTGQRHLASSGPHAHSVSPH